MDIQQNIELAPFTTFNIGGAALYFCQTQTVADIGQAYAFAKEKKLPVLVLGGGSNILISDEGFKGLVIRPEIAGIEVISEDHTGVYVKVGATEIWDNVVKFAVEKQLWGIENLSHIPGRTAGIAVQNVGAYGQEASDVIESVEVYDTKIDKITNLNNADCNFIYRHSIFNTTEQGRYVILSLTFKLTKTGEPNLSYGDVKKYFADKNQDNPTLQDMRQAIIEIRNKKFPFPDKPTSGNAGSFFRGPILNPDQFNDLLLLIDRQFGENVANRLRSIQDKLIVAQGYKTPAGFLIDICSLKSLVEGGAKINENQAAIILNYTGKATAKDVLTLYEKVKKAVHDKIGVDLEHEPEFIGF